MHYIKIRLLLLWHNHFETKHCYNAFEYLQTHAIKDYNLNLLLLGRALTNCTTKHYQPID